MAEKNQLLKNVRVELHLTQSELAEKVGVSTLTIRSWENGRRSPSLFFQKQLIHVLGKSSEDLGLSHVEGATKEKIAEQPPNPSVMRAPPTDVNRQRMIQRVRSRWITGILEHSLYQEMLITLGLQERPEVVENPWSMQLQEADLPARLLPEGTSISQVFDDVGGEFLLLGEPGAGKTTLLLELARELLIRAEQNELHPIPIVFNLSSWAEKHQKFEAWLIEELNSKYQVPLDLSRSWIASDKILLLLDGLDEVEQGRRYDCIEAINLYRQSHGLVPVVVCSRSADYDAQKVRLLLRSAVVIRPLTLQQVDLYLANAGMLLPMQKMIQGDPILQEMVSNPLMLNILALTQETSENLLQGDFLERRHQVIAKYVERVFKHRSPSSRYSKQQILHYLTWLAKQMKRKSQTEFYIENMQPDWLPDLPTRDRYLNTVSRLFFGFQTTICCCFYACGHGDDLSKPGLFFWVGGGRGNLILEWMRPGFGGIFQGAASLGMIISTLTTLIILLVNQKSIPAPSWDSLWTSLVQASRNGILSFLVVGGTSVVTFSLVGGINQGFHIGISVALFSAFEFFLMTELVFLLRVRYRAPNPSTAIVQGHQRAKKMSLVDRLINCFVCCFFGAIACVIVYVIQYETLVNAIAYATTAAFFLFILYFFLLSSSQAGFDILHDPTAWITPVETLSWSWHAVRQDFQGNIKLPLIVGGISAASGVLILTAASSIFYGWAYSLRYGTIYGLIIGLIVCLAGILTGILKSGWSSDILPKDERMKPNEGIMLSIRHSLFAAVTFGLLGGVGSGFIFALAFGLIGGLAGWFTIGLGFTIIFSILFASEFFTAFGGVAVLEHFTLRWYLWRHGDIPLNYVAFLDYASDKILLRKVGGGYIFVHRLLLEYFASL